MILPALFLAAFILGLGLCIAGLVGPRDLQRQRAYLVVHAGMAVLFWGLGHPWFALLPATSIVVGALSALLGRAYLIQGTRFEAWLDRWESST